MHKSQQSERLHHSGTFECSLQVPCPLLFSSLPRKKPMLVPALSKSALSPVASRQVLLEDLIEPNRLFQVCSVFADTVGLVPVFAYRPIPLLSASQHRGTAAQDSSMQSCSTDRVVLPSGSIQSLHRSFRAKRQELHFYGVQLYCLVRIPRHAVGMLWLLSSPIREPTLYN